MAGEGKECVEVERKLLRFESIRECLIFENEDVGDGYCVAALSSPTTCVKSPPGNFSARMTVLLSPNEDRRACHCSTMCPARSKTLTMCTALGSSGGVERRRMRTVGNGRGAIAGGAWVAIKSRESERN